MDRKRIRTSHKITMYSRSKEPKWNCRNNHTKLPKKWDEAKKITWHKILMKPIPWDLTKEEEKRQEIHRAKTPNLNTDISKHYIPKEHVTIYRCQICEKPFNRKTIRAALNNHLRSIRKRKNIGYCVKLQHTGGRFTKYKLET